MQVDVFTTLPGPADLLDDLGSLNHRRRGGLGCVTPRRQPRHTVAAETPWALPLLWHGWG
jgi:hypothetical protein